jgi:hypothetical protein
VSPFVFLLALTTVVGTAAFTIIKVVRLWTSRRDLPSADLAERLDALEQKLDSLQQEQAETQERLDFAERLLSKARDERQLGR